MTPASRSPLAVAAACLVLLALEWVFAPAEIARGWLAAFLFCSSPPLGAVALMLIVATTGGRWGEAAQPALSRLALATPGLLVGFTVLLAVVRWTYPWAHEPSIVAADVGRLYLNPLAFALRGAVALLGWAALAWLTSSRRLGALGSGLGLVFHGVAVTVVAVDWALSLDPLFSDSAIGMELATQQILMALAFVGVTQPARAVAVAGGEIGGLLLASALGAFYLGLMTFIVKWYGDQPDDAAWYLIRNHGAPFVFLVLALAFGALAPIVGLAWMRVRDSANGLRVASASILVGAAAHDLWLVDASALSAFAALAAALVMAISLSWLGLRVNSRSEARLA